MVDTISREMAACGAIGAAEVNLVQFLEIHWGRLESFGVCDDELEHECRQFAIAAWAGFQKRRREVGAA
jgi:hypothetical protein